MDIVVHVCGQKRRGPAEFNPTMDPAASGQLQEKDEDLFPTHLVWLQVKQWKKSWL